MIVLKDPRPDATPEWDDLLDWEKEEEWNLGTSSSFYGAVNFEPVWCHDCNTDVFLDDRGNCPVEEDHDVWSLDPSNYYALEY